MEDGGADIAGQPRQVVVGLVLRPRLDLLRLILGEGRLGGDVTRDPQRVGGDLAILRRAQVVGEIAGAWRGSRLLMRTVPRLVGLRLQTLAVMAGKSCSGWPKASRLSGWT